MRQVYGMDIRERVGRMKWRAATEGRYVGIRMEVDGKEYGTTLELFRCSPRKLRQIIDKFKHSY